MGRSCPLGVGGAALAAAIAWAVVACATGGDDDVGAGDAGSDAAPVRDSGGGAWIDSGAAPATGSGDDGGFGGGGDGGGNGGACSAPCPGEGQTTANIACDVTSGCSMSCKGESYDVNDKADDGCEVADSPTGNHAQMAAVSKGELSCTSAASDALVMTGMLPSDKRVHETPAVDNFSTQTGAAPDYFAVKATGGTFCRNQVSFTFTVTGAAAATPVGCYKLTVVTNLKTLTCTTDAALTCKLDGDNSGNYDGDTMIYFTVEKTCPAASAANAAYTVSGHL